MQVSCGVIVQTWTYCPWKAQLIAHTICEFVVLAVSTLNEFRVVDTKNTTVFLEGSAER